MLKSKETMELEQIYLTNLNKLAIITNFLTSFLFLFENSSLLDLDLDPDPGWKINTDPCGSGSTALQLTI